MLRVPARFAAILVAFAPVFVQARTWQRAQMLLLGALLVPGQRTVCSILRIIGLRQERHFVTWHRVLSRAVWDSRGRNQLPPRPTPHAAENTSTRIAPARVGYSAVAERRQRRAFDWLAQGRSAERSRVERSRRQGHTFQVRLQIEL